MRKLDGLKISIYIIAIIISGIITAQFGYLVYLLNFTDNLGYSFSLGVIGEGILVDALNKNLPIGFMLLFIVLLIITVLLLMSLKSILRKIKIKDQLH